MEEAKRDFYTSAIFWKDLKEQALWVKKIQQLLNQHLKLAHYGPALNHIVFVPIAQLPEYQHNYPEAIRFTEAEKSLSLYLCLDYEQVAQANEPHFLQLLAQRFLEGIEQAGLEKVEGFDAERFIQDVKRVLMADDLADQADF